MEMFWKIIAPLAGGMCGVALADLIYFPDNLLPVWVSAVLLFIGLTIISYRLAVIQGQL